MRKEEKVRHPPQGSSMAGTRCPATDLGEQGAIPPEEGTPFILKTEEGADACDNLNLGSLCQVK